ncbi:hypothetical protein D3C81_309370 [compost metagenome]
MDEELILSLVKERLGIRSSVRDTYLSAIVSGIIAELEREQGVVLDSANPAHLMFCVDFATWRYTSRDESGAIPRHLQFRLHNLIISAGGEPS